MDYLCLHNKKSMNTGDGGKVGFTPLHKNQSPNPPRNILLSPNQKVKLSGLDSNRIDSDPVPKSPLSRLSTIKQDEILNGPQKLRRYSSLPFLRQSLSDITPINESIAPPKESFIYKTSRILEYSGFISIS